MNAKIDISGLVLKTRRLTLRPWRYDDLEDFYAYARVDGVGQLAGWKPHKNREETREILNRFISGRHTLALEYNGHAIGSLSIGEYSEQYYPELAAMKGRDLGYALSREYWGQGLMPEALNAVINWLFSKVGLDFILAGYFDFNAQSARVMEKCGFKYIKTCPYITAAGSNEATVQSILYNPKLRRE